MNKKNTLSVLRLVIFLFLSLYFYYYSSQERGVLAELSKDKPQLQGDNKLKTQVRICSQNLMRLGEKSEFSKEFTLQASFLAERIRKSSCDIIAFQEVVGDETKSKNVLNKFFKFLEDSYNIPKFNFIVAKSNDAAIRNAIAFKEEMFDLSFSEHLYHYTLPKLTPKASPWSFARGPLFVGLKLEKFDNEKGLAIITYHLKSKSRGYKDKSGLDFEMARVLSAAGIRERINDFMAGEGKDYVEVMLGDRNSDSRSASSQILSGELDLNDFRGNSACKITFDEGAVDCPEGAISKPNFIPLLSEKNAKEGSSLATHKFRGRENILDEIYVSKEDSKASFDSSGKVAVGIEGTYRDGSDHLLVWVDLQI